MSADVGAKVVELRRAGVAFEKIAGELGLDDRDAAVAAYEAHVSRDGRFDPILEAERLDRMLAAVWPKARSGDLKAAEMVLKISERREHLLASPEQFDHPLREAFDRTVEAARGQLVDGLDDAIIEAGRTFADRIDAAQATGSGLEVTKALHLMPHLKNVLAEMLATPASRQAAAAAAAEKGVADAKPVVGGKLGQLRAVEGGRRRS